MKKYVRLIAVLLAAVFLFSATACSLGRTPQQDTDSTDGKKEISDPLAEKLKAEKAKATKNVKVTVKMKDMGSFTLELYPQYAPETVNNFLKLVESGFYSGSKFHRVVEGFMAQGGISAKGKTADTIKGEFINNGFFDNTLKHEKGVISMARANNPNSASSQFFICYDDCPHLDGDYAAFGKVIEGMEVVDSFLNIQRTENGFDPKPATPVTDIVIESMTVEK